MLKQKTAKTAINIKFHLRLLRILIKLSHNHNSCNHLTDSLKKVRLIWLSMAAKRAVNK